MERHPTPSAVLRAGSYRHSDISVNFTDVDVLHVGDTWWNGVYPFIDYFNRGGPEFGQASLLAISLSVALAALGLAMAIYLDFRQRNRDNIRPSICGPDGTKAGRSPGGKGSQAIRQEIDHSGEAEKVGLQMRPTKLLIFGNPKAGTPLMIAASGIAIDLPLKVLVWEDSDGTTKISYNTLEYLQARHALPAELVPNIAIVETLAKSLAE
jgi:uncharacterized protein (DUF302 family)